MAAINVWGRVGQGEINNRWKETPKALKLESDTKYTFLSLPMEVFYKLHQQTVLQYKTLVFFLPP